MKMPLEQAFQLRQSEEASAPTNPVVKTNPEGGLITNWWLWIAKVKIGAEPDNAEAQVDVSKVSPANQVTAPKADQPEEPSDEKAPGVEPPEPKDGENEALQMILDHPNISGVTFLNLLKSKGFKIVSLVSSGAKQGDEDTKEADSASANPQAVRAGVKKESDHIVPIRARFMESSARNDAIGWTRARCVLLQEGLGNFGDAAYYSRASLESAVPVFEGKKIYADHPSAIDDQIRPERSVRDIMGHFENVSLVEAEGGRGELQADVVILPDEPYRWARALLRHAVEYSDKYPDKEFIGLSINASGDAEPKDLEEVMKEAPEAALPKLMKARDEMGLTEVRYVSMIDDAVSCDLVTEAGAGGKILNLLEQEKKTMAKKAIKESKEKEKIEKKAEGEAPEAPAKKDDKAPEAPAPKASADAGGDDAHDDKAQDIELIKKMIAKYMAGNKSAAKDDAESVEENDMEGEKSYNEEEAKLATEAYECYKEMGHSEEEAMEKAGSALKLAKHMQAKKEKAAVESKEAGEDKMEADQMESEDGEKKEEAKESEQKKESAQAQIVRQAGQIAKLESELKKFKMAEALDTMCAKSGLGMAESKRFKALEAVKNARNEKELATLLDVFKESFNIRGGEASDVYGFITTEKTTLSESKKTSKEIDLSSCVND